MKGRTDKSTDGRNDGWTFERTDERTNGRTEGRMDERMNGAFRHASRHTGRVSAEAAVGVNVSSTCRCRSNCFSVIAGRHYVCKLTNVLPTRCARRNSGGRRQRRRRRWRWRQQRRTASAEAAVGGGGGCGTADDRVCCSEGVRYKGRRWLEPMYDARVRAESRRGSVPRNSETSWPLQPLKRCEVFHYGERREGIISSLRYLKSARAGMIQRELVRVSVRRCELVAAILRRLYGHLV